MEAAQDMESSITRAMRARIKDFKDQADSLTLEGVRRMLEKDMGLETHALDSHKRFVKKCLNECFESLDDENVAKNSSENSQQTIHLEKDDTNASEELKPQKEVNGPGSGDEEKIKGSPVSVEKAKTERGNEETQGSVTESAPNKETIKKAIRKRASYFRANSEKTTMSGVRRLLEEDLKLEKNALDAFKSFISEQLEEVLQAPEVEPKKETKKKSVKKASEGGSKKVKKVKENSESESNTSLSADEEVDEDEIKPKKRITQKGKVSTTEGSKKRKRSTDESTSISNGKKKAKESAVDKSSDTDEGGNVSEDDNSQSSAEENVKKKKETPTFSYGKRVEHLKSIIKSCGMGVPPSVYKKAKQVPENKREAYIIKELEEILRKEGLSTNPSEKEIKEVKKKKETAKELEGIDMSNIVSSTRRRSTFNFIMPPPKPKIPVDTDEDDDDDDDDGEDTDVANSDSEDASDGFNEDADDESE